MHRRQVSDPYATLGVSPDVNEDTLRVAWRRVARTTHPDAGGSPEAFAEAREAFELLLDPKRRAAFDASVTAQLASAAAGVGLGAASELGELLSTLASAHVAWATWSETGRFATGQLARQTRSELDRCTRILEDGHEQLGRLCARLGLDPAGLAAPEFAEHAIAAWIRAGGQRPTDAKSDLPRHQPGHQPGHQPSTSQADLPLESDRYVPEGAPVYRFSDGSSVICATLNAKGAWVCDEATRRHYHMGPRFILSRLRPDDPVWRLAPPTIGYEEPWHRAARICLVGPAWLVVGPWWHGVVVGCTIGTAASFSAGTSLLYGGCIGGLVGLWWPIGCTARALARQSWQRAGWLGGSLLLGSGAGVVAGAVSSVLGASNTSSGGLIIAGALIGGLVSYVAARFVTWQELRHNR